MQYSKNTKQVSGFTLVEVMITMGLLTLIIGVGLSAMTFISQSSQSLVNYSEMTANGRQSLEILARDIRMGYQVNEATTTKLDFRIYGEAGSTDQILYLYDDTSKSLFRFENGTNRTEVMEDLNDFNFTYFNLRREKTVKPISIKEVQIEGTLKKDSLRISNTDHIISARYMMRNRSVSN